MMFTAALSSPDHVAGGALPHGAPVDSISCPSFLFSWTMGAVAGFFRLLFWFGCWFGIFDAAHHPLHHGTVAFFHLFNVLPDFAPELFEFGRIFWRQNQMRAVRNVLIRDGEWNHV